MHILVLHGYTLQGTGSNVYVANISKSLKELGHKVTVVCQDRYAEHLDFIDDYYVNPKELNLKSINDGELRVVVPNIDNLLPVFIYDEYEGYEVKEMQDLTEAEVNNHVNKVSSIIKDINKQDSVDLIIANHALLNPLIAMKAVEDTAVPYDIKIHGSDLEFSLARYPRLMKYAVEAFEKSRRVIAGTNHIENRVKDIYGSDFTEKQLNDKIVIIPPGMDPTLFNYTLDKQQTEKEFLKRVRNRLCETSEGRGDLEFSYNYSSVEELQSQLVDNGTKYNQRVLDSNLLDKWKPIEKNDVVLFYFGKFLQTKGIGELLIMAPSIIKNNPNVRFVLSGFGGYREHLETILYSFKTGNLQLLKDVASAGNFVSEINIEDYFFKADQWILDRITITGFLEHNLLSQLLPLADISIVASKLAEAFGMVAVEAMAAGVIPICNDHSGLSDILNHMESDFSELLKITRKNKDIFFKELPTTIDSTINYLFTDDKKNREFFNSLKIRLNQFSKDNFSWSNIAEMLAEL